MGMIRERCADGQHEFLLSARCAGDGVNGTCRVCGLLVPKMSIEQRVANLAGFLKLAAEPLEKLDAEFSRMMTRARARKV